jgi:hypothetical protein
LTPRSRALVYKKGNDMSKKKATKKKVIKHLKGDIETFKHEAHEDKELIKELKHKKPSKKKRK